MVNVPGIFYFYIIALGFAVGIGLRSVVTLGLPEVTWLMLVAVAVLLLAYRKAVPSASLVYVAVVMMAVALGVLRLEVATWSEVVPAYDVVLGSETIIEGVIVREPDERERLVHLYVKTDKTRVLATTDSFLEYAYGDVVQVRGIFEKPEAFTTDLGRTFNYPGYLKARGVSYIMPLSNVTVQYSGAGNPVIATLLSFKHTFMREVELQITEPAAGLGEGLLLGVKRALGPDLEDAFRTTGIIHIVVLSGYNVMLVVAFVMYCLRAWLRPRAQVAFGVLAVAAFAILVGLSATVVRASLMAALLLFLQATGRVYVVTRALILAGLVMLIINPYLLVFDVGFQLSFMATLGLIFLAPLLIEKVTFMPTTIGLREFFVATLATQIFVLPLLLYQIGEFSVVSVIVNVLVLPMVPVAMMLTFITGMVSFVLPGLALYFGLVTQVSLMYIVRVAEWFAALPFASFVVPAFPLWLMFVSYALLGYFLWWYQKKNPSQTETDSLANWTIVEEADFIKNLESKPY